ncbi:hypothetical protein B0H14DRAFT_2562783 [Mycena olivaceomarginata]|nr:hypothetical protein B0H14DRAFT_2562783 [Mycena olivaceomarginata]
MHVGELSRDSTVLRVLSEKSGAQHVYARLLKTSRDLGGMQRSGLRTVDEELVIGPIQEGRPSFAGTGDARVEGDMSGDLVDTEREQWNTLPSAASELVGGIRVGQVPGERKQSRQEDHGNTEQMRNAETGAPHTVYMCNLVLFMLTGDKGEGQAKYTLKADAEGGTCMDG